mmetsp:Transcript_2750/g.3930  ORF Transcript_2750/g.3930 Transcript_2750/m.3930 type:complete len:80 (-) Transcript_2750:44-283(-)
MFTVFPERTTPSSPEKSVLPVSSPHALPSGRQHFKSRWLETKEFLFIFGCTFIGVSGITQPLAIKVQETVVVVGRFPGA